MSEQVYRDLREFLDRMPTGFPFTPTGVELRILEKLFTPEEARLAMKLSQAPEPVSEISRRIGLPESEAEAALEAMAGKGLIFRRRESGESRYQAFQFMIGLYEFQVHRLDREFCELFEEYLPYMGRSLSTIRTKQLRVVPVEKSVDGSQAVAPYNSVRELVGGAKDIVVTDCICQKEQRLLGHTCDKPEETCLAFGDFARFYRDNGMGRPVTREEALAILDRAEAHGLVLSPSNTQELAALCCCCTCCCPVLKFARMMPRPADRVVSHYRAAIDPELCAACGDCLERCPMEAIEEGDAASRVLAHRCIGCGLCASACPEGAIAMEAKPGMEAPPKDFDEVMRKIAAERQSRRSPGAPGGPQPVD